MWFPRLLMLSCSTAGCLLASAVVAQQPADSAPMRLDEPAAEGSSQSEGSAQTEVPATYNPDSPPWESIENSVIIPEVDTSEDAEWLLVDEDVEPVDPEPWLLAFGYGQAGAAGSELDRAGVLLGGGVGLARLAEPSVDTQTLHVSSESLFMLSGLVELGTSPGEEAAPFVVADLLGPRLNRDDRDDGIGTLTLRRDMVWGAARLRRNMRVDRGVRAEVALAAIQLRTVWFERTNVATIIHLSADLPGYAHVSSQGRGGTFNGINVTRVSADVGPRFGSSSGPWGRFMIGGEASAAAGVAAGPNATIRTDLSTWVGVDVHAHDHLLMRMQLAMDVARDTYRSLSDSAWRAALTVVSRF